MAVSPPSFSDFIRNRFIRIILFAGLFIQLGIWVRNFAILLFVMEQTNGDPFAVSMISVAEFAPIFIFSIIGGTFADRWRPKRTMVWCDVLSAISVFAVLILLLFASWKAVFFATLVSSILSQFSQPSGMKLFKLHVPEEQMQMGMSIYQTMFAVFMIIGPIIGTFIFNQYGIHLSIVLTGIMFLLSAGVLLFLPPDRVDNEEKRLTTVLEELVLGFKYVIRSRFLTILGSNFFAAGLSIGLITPLGIFIVTENLGLEKEQLQWLLAVNGTAMILGGGLAMAFSRKITPILLLAIGMVVVAVAHSIIGFSTVILVTLAAQFFAGLVLPAIQISINTMILKNTEEAFIGRVNGIMTPMFMGAMVFTMSIAGWLKGYIGLVAVFQASAALFIVGILLIIPLLVQPNVQESQESGQERRESVQEG